MASKGKEHASISKDLKHQIWDMMGTLRGHRNGKASSPCSLSPQEPWTSCSSAHKVLHWISDFYHFLPGCTSKVRADQVFQRNLYMHFLNHTAPWTSQLLTECYPRAPKQNYLLNKYINFPSTMLFPPTTIFWHLNYLILNTFQWPNSFSFSIIYVS